MNETEDIQIHLGTSKTLSTVQEKAWPGCELSTYVAVYGDAEKSAMSIYIRLAALEGIESHAISTLKAEVGGMLLGGVYRHDGQIYVQIEGFLPACDANEQRARLTFTHETWRQLNDEREAKYSELGIVGWYHTHPNLGVFLSDDDKFIHRNFFSEEERLALVIDPVANERAFFHQSDGKLPKLPGFYVFDDASASERIEATLDKMRHEPQAISTPAPPVQNRPVINKIVFFEPCLNIYYFLPRPVRKWLGVMNAETAPRISLKNAVIFLLISAIVYLFAIARLAPLKSVDEVEIHKRYAEAFSIAGDYEESVREYRRYLVHKPDDIVTRQKLIDALQKLTNGNVEISVIYEREINATREAANAAAAKDDFSSAFDLYTCITQHARSANDDAYMRVFGYLGGKLASEPSKSDIDIVAQFFPQMKIKDKLNEIRDKKSRHKPAIIK